MMLPFTGGAGVWSTIKFELDDSEIGCQSNGLITKVQVVCDSLSMSVIFFKGGEGVMPPYGRMRPRIRGWVRCVLRLEDTAGEIVLVMVRDLAGIYFVHPLDLRNFSLGGLSLLS